MRHTPPTYESSPQREWDRLEWSGRGRNERLLRSGGASRGVAMSPPRAVACARS